MTIRLAFLLLLAPLPLAHAQDEAPSPQTLCATHADALLVALEEARWEAAAADFDAALRTRYTPAKLQQDYEALPAKLGKAMGRGRAHTAELSGHPVVMTALIFERGLSTAEVRCDGAGAVSDFRLETTQVMGTP
ncbi:MAG: hypothetical protein ABW186_04155 [Rhodanobacteraceae bacterium]